MTDTQIDVIFTNRKSMCLEVTLTGEVKLRAPNGVSQKQINHFINKRRPWLKKHLSNARSKTKKYPEIQYEDGDKIYFKGKEYTFKKEKYIRTQILFSNDECLLKYDDDSPRLIMKNWYQNQAKNHLQSRVRELAHKHSFHYESVRITNAKTRWGSCGANNTLNFSWRLIKAPTEVIDYVILHELTHTEIKAHGKSFWSRLKEVEPALKKHRSWLKEHALMLLRD